jgi:hypothetical protein
MLTGVMLGALALSGSASAQSAPVLDVIQVEIKTGTRKHAGTDASVYMTIASKSGDRSRGYTFRLPDLPGDDHEPGKTDTWVLAVPAKERVPMTDIASISLVNGMNRSDPGWFVDSVRILAMDSTGTYWALAHDGFRMKPMARWLDTKEDTGPVAVLPLDLRKAGKAEDAPIFHFTRKDARPITSR